MHFSFVPKSFLLGVLLGSTYLVTAGTKSTGIPQTHIAELQSAPEQYEGKTVLVSGTLRTAGADYFSDPQFVLSDGDSMIPVRAWAPLELPPLDPTASMREVPYTMRDFVGQHLSIKATYRNRTAAALEVISPAATAKEPYAGVDVLPGRGDVPAANSSSKILVLLADFPDRPGQTPAKFFEDLLFGQKPRAAPNGSLKDYYTEISYGQLNVTGTVTAVWLRLPEPSYFYSGGCFGIGRQSQCPQPQYPRNSQKMAEDAIAAAKRAGVDFAAYDGNNDGRVDSLFIIHAGRGAEFTLNPDDVWSHRGMLPARVETESTNTPGQRVFINTYTTVPEYLQVPGDMTIGIVAHEFGHDLGLPDLHDLTNGSAGAGRWSLMSSGCWNGNGGDMPAHLDAWGKYMLGWVKPRDVLATLGNEHLMQAATTPVVYQYPAGNPSSGEYFLIENRQRIGFDRSLPGSGMLIWHVDNNAADNTRPWYPGCSGCRGYYRVALMQADGQFDLERNRNHGDAGDPFPGVCHTGSCNLVFNDASIPSATFHTGLPSRFSVTSISSSAAQMTVTLYASTFPNVSGWSMPSPGTLLLPDVTDFPPATGYGRILPQPGATAPSGMSILEWRSNGVLVDELSLSASAPVRTGRIPSVVASGMNTGIALANTNDAPALVSFFFTTGDGRDFGHGTLQLPPRTLMTRFVTESPFSVRHPFEGTFTFDSTVPIGALAMRSFVDARSGFLMGNLPVVALDRPSSSTLLPHYVEGAGWSTQLILVNPTNARLDGSVALVFADETVMMRYTIAPRGQQTLERPISGYRFRQGYTQLIPDPGSPAPSLAGLLAQRASGTMVSFTGLMPGAEGTSFRLYAESEGDFKAGQAESVETALVAANPHDTAVTVRLQMLRLDGTNVSSTSAVIPGRTSAVFFLRDMPQFAAIGNSFKGLLRISTDSGRNISVLGLRARYNERLDFLLTGLTPSDDYSGPEIAERIFPLFVSGNGAATRTVLFNTAGETSRGFLRLYSHDGENVGPMLR